MTPQRTIAQAQEKFKRFLTDKGLRATRVRAAILKTIYESPGHFDADELYLSLKSQGFNVSKASVYRTIPLLIDSGLIDQIYFEDGHLHYEPALGRENHLHLRCIKCRAMIEFSADTVSQLTDRLAAEYGYRISGHMVEIFGLCPDCQEKDNKA